MRCNQKKRRRSRVEVLEEKLYNEKALRTEATKKLDYTKTFWERWHWELQQRKEAMEREKVILTGIGNIKTRRVLKLHLIEPHLLCNPLNISDDESMYVGRRSFGRVRGQLYRGIRVAVKEFLPHSVAADVLHEARVLSVLCYPYLPFLFGVNTSVCPYRLVMQYHTLQDKNTATTSEEALCNSFTLKYGSGVCSTHGTTMT